MTVVTRFAPSPTGFLHIGGARSALFNYLYAKHHGGQFHLRIEDTDKDRNNEDTVRPILDGLKWLGLDWDGEVVRQSERAHRHVEVAKHLLDIGAAYRCYTSQEEIASLREAAMKKKKPFLYQSPWRDYEGTMGLPYVVRLKAERAGTTTLDDLVQGQVSVKNNTLDDMIILRADGTPTYMLAVVVDDHDAGVTHVFRGDDHLNNTFRQLGIIRAMGWDAPAYGHIPLIHDETGKKLSKRHNAVGIDYYADNGILPDALFNYLLRMGWGKGDHELLTREQAVEMFDIDGVGRAPARLDPARLTYLNGHYIREMASADLVDIVAPKVIAHVGHGIDVYPLLNRVMPSLQTRYTDLNAIAEASLFYFHAPAVETQPEADRLLLSRVVDKLSRVDDFTHDNIETAIRELCGEIDAKLKTVMAAVRMAITGEKNSPPMFEAMEVIGKAETIHRLFNIAEVE